VLCIFEIAIAGCYIFTHVPEMDEHVVIQSFDGLMLSAEMNVNLLSVTFISVNGVRKHKT
jgi:hypothetical protein